MYKIIYNFFLSFIFFFLAIIFVSSCKKDEVAAPVLATIDTKLAANPDLSIFKKAITQAKLETFTKGPGPFTILAPTNTALADAGITESSLTSID
ncbi:MAG: fasciclin domain-containing protein, partial [Pedobacter sp.]|nr:fasciclin domain-containing protein [Pedobacter sp.]